MSTDRNVTRRSFIRQTAAGSSAVGLFALSAKAATAAPGANDRINIGSIGVGGRGNAILSDLLKRAKDPKNNLQVLAVCDI